MRKGMHLSVGKDGAIVTLEEAVTHVPCYVVEDDVLSHFDGEQAGELEFVPVGIQAAVGEALGCWL